MRPDSRNNRESTADNICFGIVGPADGSSTDVKAAITHFTTILRVFCHHSVVKYARAVPFLPVARMPIVMSRVLIVAETTLS